MNPFYNAMNTSTLQAQIARLKQQYANPQDAIQQLMNSGRITQAQYNAAVQKAKQIQQFLK